MQRIGRFCDYNSIETVRKGAVRMEDAKIVEQFFERDEAALKNTEEKYGKYCYRLAYQILGHEEDTKETVNDTYYELWNSIPPHRPAFLSAFIGKITRRLAISRYRKRTAAKRGNGEYELTLSELSECIPDSNRTEEIVEGRQTAAQVSRFLRELPETERNVFICRYWYMDSVKMVAKRFGFSESKTKSMLMRTRQKLQKRLMEEG